MTDIEMQARISQLVAERGEMLKTDDDVKTLHEELAALGLDLDQAKRLLIKAVLS